MKKWPPSWLHAEREVVLKPSSGKRAELADQAVWIWAALYISKNSWLRWPIIKMLWNWNEFMGLLNIFLIICFSRGLWENHVVYNSHLHYPLILPYDWAMSSLSKSKQTTFLSVSFSKFQYSLTVQCNVSMPSNWSKEQEY